VEGPAHCVHGGFGVALDVGDAEGPIFDLAAGAKPLVGPGKNYRTRRPGVESRPDLPVERMRLRQLAMPHTVETQLGQQQRAVAADVLQTRQVGLQLTLSLQIDIERNHIEKGQVEVFRRRIIDVGDDRLGVLLFGDRVEPIQVASNAAAAEPARLRGHDLVSQRETQQRRVTSADPHFGAIAIDEIERQIAVYQITCGLLGGQPDHDPQPMSRGYVEKRAWRHGMRDAHGIDAQRRHLREIPLDQPVVGIFATALVGPEGAISDATNKVYFAVRRQKLAVDSYTVNKRADRAV
jgi:hypothetical protein